jgi:hypothetical protein
MNLNDRYNAIWEANPVLIYHFDEAPICLKDLAVTFKEHKYIILIPTGIYANAESFERRLNIVRAEDILKRFGVEDKCYAGTVNLQITPVKNISCRVFIV